MSDHLSLTVRQRSRVFYGGVGGGLLSRTARVIFLLDM